MNKKKISHSSLSLQQKIKQNLRIHTLNIYFNLYDDRERADPEN